MYWQVTKDNESVTGINTITIAAKTISAKANDQTIKEGNYINTHDITYSGVLTADDVQITPGEVAVFDENGKQLTESQVKALKKGTYKLKVTTAGSKSGDKAGYYAFTGAPQDGTLTVLEEEKVVVTWDYGKGLGSVTDEPRNINTKITSAPEVKSLKGYSGYQWYYMDGSTKKAFKFADLHSKLGSWCGRVGCAGSAGARRSEHRSIDRCS